MTGVFINTVNSFPAMDVKCVLFFILLSFANHVKWFYVSYNNVTHTHTHAHTHTHQEIHICNDQLNRANIFSPYLYNLNRNIIILFVPKLAKLSVPFRFSD
jgi:hypothetical protein